MRQFLATEEATTFDAKSAFLGGTINGSTWREQLKALLTIKTFDPVVEDWTVEDKQREEQAKSACGILVYGLSPKMTGFYSIVELTVSALLQNHKQLVVFVIWEDAGVKFDEHQEASIRAMMDLLSTHRGGIQWTSGVEETARILNQLGKPDEPA